MKYVSIDIETTGLDPDKCQIIEFAAVVDDLKSQKPLDQLPQFQTFVRHKFYQGEPYALAMHPRIFKRLAASNPDAYEEDVVDAGALYARFYSFLSEKGGYKDCSKVVVAGKNFANFDKRFLDKLPNQHELVKFHHRILDPGMFFLDVNDEAPPSGGACLERAGMKGHVAHTALEDALMVVQLMRAGISRIQD